MSGKSKALPTIVVASAGIAAGAAVAFAGFLLKRRAVRTTCKPFYAEATRRFKIPGISEGFVPQDLFYLSDEQTWLFSGYLANRRPSPIYQVGADGTVRRHEVRLPEGSLYRGHGAAVTAAGPFVFLTVRDGFIALDRAELAKAADGDVLQATGHRAVPLMPAFMTVQKDMLYIGEFSHRLFYPTPKSHWLRCPSGETNPALLLAYAPHDGGPFGFGEHPSAVYSIPGNVQGMCVTPEGNIVLSLAWGFGGAAVLPGRSHAGGDAYRAAHGRGHRRRERRGVPGQRGGEQPLPARQVLWRPVRVLVPDEGIAAPSRSLSCRQARREPMFPRENGLREK